MSTLITLAMISKETLMLAQNNLVVTEAATWYNDEFKRNPRIGSVYNVRRPILMTPRRGNMAWVGSNSAALETSIPLVINDTITQELSFTAADLSLRLEKFSERFLKPIVRQIAGTFDLSVFDSIVNSSLPVTSATTGLGGSGGLGSTTQLPSSAGYVVGAYGTALTTATILAAKRYLTDVGCPDDGEIYGFLSSGAQSDLVAQQASLFNPLMLVDKVYRSGQIGKFAGIEFTVTQSAAAHTNGTLANLIVSTGTATSGWTEAASLTVTSTTGIQAGDMFQAPATIRLVNPLTKAPSALPAQFQVLSVTDGTHVVVAPAPISAGPYKNISATIDGATLTLVGASGASGAESLILHKSALAVASVDIPQPGQGEGAVGRLIKDPDTDGLSLSYIKFFDALGISGVAGAGGVGSSGMASAQRFDVMFGTKVVNPSWVVRIRN